MNHGTHYRTNAAATLLAAAIGALAAAWCYMHNYTLYYGDADAHLNIARRILDSRTPGPSQIGTVWLPLPHLLLAPFAQVDGWWQSGLAGVFPSVAAFAAAAGFLFAAARLAFHSAPAAWAATLLFVLNPNMLYLQSAPMTEALLAACLAALLYATLRFREAQSVAAIVAAAAASNAASLTRYEGWFLIPFVALYFWIVARDKRPALLFAALASLGPLAWLAHNVYYYGNALAFYNGPYSALAIYQRQLANGLPDPGAGDWMAAARYYFAAVRLVDGTPLAVLGAAGAVVAVARRCWWPVIFLALPGAFYIWSVHSGGTPVFVPELPPFSRYNTRYALAVLPLAAFAAGAAVLLIPAKFRAAAAVALPAAIATLWMATASPLSACWQESANASRARIARNSQAAAYLAGEYQRGQGIVFNFGDLAGVLRQAGIPLRETLYQDNVNAWRAVQAQPASLQETWALTIEGDPVWQLLRQAPAYQLRRRIMVEGAPPIELYRRSE